VLALAVLLSAGLAACSGGPSARAPLGGSATQPTTGAPSARPSAPPTATPTTATPTTATPTTAPRPPAPVGPGAPAGQGLLRLGARGPEVLALQRRLLGLGFWLGTADGTFGESTVHAVTAFQKSVGLARDGVAGSVTLRTLTTASRPVARSRAGRVIEVDLRRQLLLVVRDGRVEWVLDTSTGAVPGSTPVGRFSVFRQVDGYDTGPLGVLYRPKYFIRGVAVHGYPSVPAYPASHGCVRVTDASMDWIWANRIMPIGQPVWVY
jgi:peptidoglycan hydrolase-like protein with peptidoglycan-binding domain